MLKIIARQVTPVAPVQVFSEGDQDHRTITRSTALSADVGSDYASDAAVEYFSDPYYTSRYIDREEVPEDFDGAFLCGGGYDLAEALFGEDLRGKHLLYRVIDADTVEYALAEVVQEGSFRYFIVAGHGTDGGFGDYSPPHYSDPIRVGGEVLWFSEADDAEAVVSELNDRSARAFYATPRDQYGGEFPMEYKVISVPEPSGPAWGREQAITAVEVTDAPGWGLSLYD